MLKNLRNRLFLSYLVVLIVALALVIPVTLTTLASREVPAEFTWNRLELLLTGFTSPGAIRGLLAEVAEGTVDETLEAFATNSDVRIMLLSRGDETNRMLYDSGGEYGQTYLPDFEIEEQRSPPERDNNNSPGSNNSPGGSNGPGSNNSPSSRRPAELGRFFENDTEWLYVSISWGVDRNRSRDRANEIVFVIAEPRSTDTARAAVKNFNDLLFRPLIRSAAIGGFIAFIFAIFLSSSITRPLQALAKSAQYVAKGEFSEQVPETGPAEIKQVASAFNRMTGEVRAAQLSQQEFMANVSHDLKTPLTSIQGYSQAIMDDASDDPKESAKIINDEAERLNRMVQELTDLARLQAGRLSMKLSPLDVNEVVEAIANRLSLVAEQANIEIIVNTSPLPIIAADGDRLVQVLTNLVGNAIKYTQSGGKIWVETGVRNGGVEIIVQDNGMGIPAEDLPHIFDRFYQVDKSRGPSRGTGLGLAITQEIVQGHGGTINIFSAGVNQGTKVTVWLPSPNSVTIVTRRPIVE